MKTLTEQIAHYPQLSEKALIDFVNGLEVTADHLRVREKSDGLGSRIWGSITGNTAHRQQEVDKTFQSQLATSLTWLQGLDARQAESDLAMTVIADKLTETRAGVMKLQSRIQQNDAATRNALDAVWTKLVTQEKHNQEIFQRHEHRLKSLEWKTAATEHLELVLCRWRDGRYAEHGVAQRLFVVCNTLHWGNFGDWLRHTTPADRAQLLEITESKLKNQLKEDCGGDTALPMREWLANSTPPPDEEVLHYLANDYRVEQGAPLPLLAGDTVQRNNNAAAWNSLELPRYASIPKMVHSMLRQTELSVAHLKGCM